MSRSYRYDEDWQRRKSILIRSLFHDIPILSPVPEESTDSFQHVPNDDVFNEPPRPYSPLPPLIIEREPKINKHDEPEEYYRKLHYKIKKIYIKLFIENRDLSSDDYDLNYSDSSVDNNDDDNLIQNNESVDINLDYNLPENNILGPGNIDSVNDVRDDSDSTISNGYGADFESMDTEIIDVVNYTDLNEDEVMRYEDDDREASEPKESNRVRMDEQESIEEESDYETTGDEDQNKTEELSKVRTDDEEFVEEESAEVRTCDQKKNRFEELNKVKNKKTSEESNHSTIDNHELTESEKSNEKLSDLETNDIEKSNNIDLDLIVSEKESKSKESKRVASETMEDDEETSHSSESGTHYRQITTAALVHVDGSQDAGERESRVYEDSVKSIILPTRQLRMLIHARKADKDDKIEKFAVLEDNEDPKTATRIITDEIETTSDEIEEMRTPRPDISHGTIPITHRSDSRTPSEHISLRQEPTALTSSSQDGGDNVLELETSDDMNEVLASIFNDSRNKEKPSNRKRKIYEDISVQTSEKVTWDDLRGDFFMATPKIFRLCACVDHICR